MFFFSWTITHPVKIWIKWELSEISKSSILSIGQNRKLGNLGNFPFCSKSYWNLLVFVSIHFFGLFKSWITISVIIRGKRNFRDFWVFDLGYRAKSKTWKSRKFLFFLLNHIGTFQFFAQFIKKLLDTLKLFDIIPVFEKLNHSNEPNYRTVSILPLVLKKFEKIMYDKLYEYIENFLSQLLCGFRTAISTIPTFTKTSKELDSGGFIGTILIDFSKAYDFLPRDLHNTRKKAFVVVPVFSIVASGILNRSNCLKCLIFRGFQITSKI